VDETDQVRPPPREAACRETRVIVELLDDLEHSRACLFAHVRFIVENSRDCLDGYACRLRDIVDPSSSIGWSGHGVWVRARKHAAPDRSDAPCTSAWAGSCPYPRASPDKTYRRMRQHAGDARLNQIWWPKSMFSIAPSSLTRELGSMRLIRSRSRPPRPSRGAR